MKNIGFKLIQEFRRDGNDLHMVQRIGLVEALCGFQITITHLDGRQLLVKYPPGKVIEPGKTIYYKQGQTWWGQYHVPFDIFFRRKGEAAQLMEIGVMLNSNRAVMVEKLI